jgi:hypothetical protein
MQDLASRVVDGKNVCAKVGKGGHWDRRVATIDIEGDHVILRESGRHARVIWRAPLSRVHHPTFQSKSGVQRFEARGHEPLFLYAQEHMAEAR